MIMTILQKIRYLLKIIDCGLNSLFNTFYK